MEIISSNHGCYFDVYQRSYPPEFHGYAGYNETHLQLADDVSQGALCEVCFQGVRIHYGQLKTLKSDTIRTTEDFSSVDMTFQLQGRTVEKSSGSGGHSPHQHTLSYRPYADVCYQFDVGMHHYVGIQLTETFFCRFADDNSPSIARLMNSLIKKEACALSQRPLPITPVLQTQLNRLTQTPHQHPLKRLHLETMVLDLLGHQIDQAGTYQDKATKLTTSDADKIRAVKALLDSNPLGNYSLLQLSRFAGLNDCKLKKGFREDRVWLS